MIQNQPIIHDNRFIVQPLFPNRNYQLTSSQAAPSKQSNMITNSKEIWQAPVENKFNQSLPRQQNLSSPNLNIQ